MSAAVPVLDTQGGESPWALAGAGIVVRYQPIVALADRLPIGVEVLARLDHPGRGMLAPEHFVPQMEGAGLGRHLTERVAALAFADFTRHLAGLGLRLALNFPLQVLLDCAALTALDGFRAAAGIGPDQVLIELTESQPLNVADPAEIAAFGTAMRRLRGLGYGLAIDDVSPETANLRTLMGLGFTVLKLDRGVVEDSARAPCACRFLRETIAAASAAGLTVIAEGIADETDWRRMQAFGVDQAQGYLVSPPLAAPCVGEWLRTWRVPTA